MKESLKTLKDIGVGMYDEKKSHFIACSAPISSEEEALEFMKKIKGWHKRAHHYVYAYTVYDENDVMISRCTDDKEPQGSAGLASLSVLQGQNIENSIVVVARYYGGIALGAAGLTRAYKKVSGMAVRSSGTCTLTLFDELFITVDYRMYDKIQHLLHSNTCADVMILKHKILEERYSENVDLHMYTAVGDTDKMCSLLTESASGQIQINRVEKKGRYDFDDRYKNDGVH